jgi:hypothetical protein
VPLSAHPYDDPASWTAAVEQGPGALAVINLPARLFAAYDGIADPDAAPWAAVVEGIDRLVMHGVECVGHVSLGYATRPLVDLIGEITRWAVMPVTGIFLDHAPAGPYQIGPVALATRVARRAGLGTLVLNPGVPVDPLYRRIDATVCTFEGSWSEYQEWSGEGAEPGDGHIVYGVPPALQDAARDLAAMRGAGLSLVTNRTGPYVTPALTAAR